MRCDCTNSPSVGPLDKAEVLSVVVRCDCTNSPSVGPLDEAALLSVDV